jgi:glutamine amidotransferase
MCRHLAYLGPPVALGALLFDAPHSLSEQAARPWHQAPGRINQDGWGVAWLDQDGTARTYRTVTPMWDDDRFPDRAATSDAFMAAARLASPGSLLEPSGNAPFTSDGWSFSLNGYVGGFRDGLDVELRAELTEQRRTRIVGDADTAVVFAMVLDRVDAGDEPLSALASVVSSITARSRSKLNMLLADATTIYATRCGNSLFAYDTTIVSEPLDESDGWSEIPDHSLLVASRAGRPTVEVVPL